MWTIRYAFLFVVLLVALIVSMLQMKVALDEADIMSLSIWTLIACALAFLPSIF